MVILCLLPPLVHGCNTLGIHFLPLLFLLTILGTVWATVILGVLMHHFIEVPSIKLGHWLVRRIQARPVSPEPPGQELGLNGPSAARNA